MDRARLRQIIKEELSRAINEGSGDELRVAFVTPEIPAPRPARSQEEYRAQQERFESVAFEEAVKLADARHPGYEWELRHSFPGDTGMRVNKGPDPGYPYYRMLVFLVGVPAAPDLEGMTGGEQMNYYRENPPEDLGEGTFRVRPGVAIPAVGGKMKASDVYPSELPDFPGRGAAAALKAHSGRITSVGKPSDAAYARAMAELGDEDDDDLEKAQEVRDAWGRLGGYDGYIVTPEALAKELGLRSPSEINFDNTGLGWVGDEVIEW